MIWLWLTCLDHPVRLQCSLYYKTVICNWHDINVNA